MKKQTFVESQRSTEYGVPCVGSCVNDCLTTKSQRLDLEKRLLKSIRTKLISPVIQAEQRVKSNNYFVCFYLPASTSVYEILELKQILAEALEATGIVGQVEISLS
ncbi:hypothetical protein KC851_03680 [Candidatus Kaiserbacteria bacterium]|nr:hypothetical protein [Candidatus Kaiserbacteria bacterium]